MSSHFSLNPKDNGRIISYIRLAAFRPNHVQLSILYSLCYIPEKFVVFTYLTLPMEHRYKALENWMLRRDLNQHGRNDWGMKNMYCTLCKY